MEHKLKSKLNEAILLERKQKCREYGNAYYQNNKEKILAKLCEKTQCPLCLRTVIRNNLRKHQTYKICKKYAQLIKEIEEQDDAEEET